MASPARTPSSGFVTRDEHETTTVVTRMGSRWDDTRGTAMSVVLFDLAPQTRNAINVNLRSDVQYWTRTLSVSELKLRRAVERVGNNTYDVMDELRRRRVH